MSRKLPSPRVLRRLIQYCPKTGDFVWKKRPLWMFGGSEPRWRSWNTSWAGKPTCSSTTARGYNSGCVLNSDIYAHRVAWAIHYGEWPSGQIDHINGERTDNRIENLREVTSQENARNRRRTERNTSGIVGVSWSKRKRKWFARIGVNGEDVFLGHFDCKQDAAYARKAAERKYGFHPNHGREVNAF